MTAPLNRVRSPVKRQRAERYLLIMLLSFASSVALTRLFLFLTGYPQIGGGGLHIAHVLWGGLLLFAACVVMLAFANHWSLTLGAALCGLGVGLFIDEVGKFITQNNDYFYPAAAPIIYAFFLLSVLIYLQMRRPPRKEARVELYHAFETLQEVLDHDLDPQEHASLVARLKWISQQEKDANLARLAQELLQFLHSRQLKLAADEYTLLEHLQDDAEALAGKHISLPRLKVALIVALAGLGLVTAAQLGRLLISLVTPETFGQTLATMAASVDLRSYPVNQAWFFAYILLTGLNGLLLLSGAALLAVRRDRLGLNLGYYGLLVSLAVVNLLVFYFDQFSTIGLAAIQFVVLLGLLYYRRKATAYRD